MKYAGVVELRSTNAQNADSSVTGKPFPHHEEPARAKNRLYGSSLEWSLV
jgi:hypothetical protein